MHRRKRAPFATALMTRTRFIALALAAISVLTACGSLLESDQPASTRWWLEPSSPAVALAPETPLQVSVSVVPGLDSDRILTLDESARLNHYAGAYWPDHLPELLSSLVTRSLEANHEGPVRAGERAVENGCLLTLEARRFYGRVDASGVTQSVEVELAGRLDCPGLTRPVATSQSVAVSANRMNAIVVAFQRALDTALIEIGGQLATAG